jgi:hypothetical protein
LAKSATQVPPFALFEFVAFQVGNALQANNAKGVTILVDARGACSVAIRLRRYTPLNG